ncbi:hypothetical protein [Pseudonocardia lacus]|uniref:hypothetical protein n=1 Tax=Pseudonocardia lacus TaxID=2835865 RepID=UPI001BDD6A87|nr:hypothetical protein [Pseudonocardia lacus]
MLNQVDRVRFPHRREIAAYVLAAVPFVVDVTSTVTVNGRVTSYSDIADIVLGVALVVVVVANRVFIVEGERRYRAARIAIAVVLLLVAAFHVAGGGGLLVDLPAPLGFGTE